MTYGHAGEWRVEIDWPEPGTEPDERVRAIVQALGDHGFDLRNLGHAHVKLDANARHYIARLTLAALEVGGHLRT